MKSIIIITIVVTLLAAILALDGRLAFTNMQKVDAQMNVGNTTGGMVDMMASGSGPSANITGSIKLSTLIGNALSSQIKVNLSQSAMTAEKGVGSNSHAVAAHLGVINGYLVYTVWAIDGNHNFHRIIVDAGNGKMLSNQLISREQSMMMHGMMMRSGSMMTMLPGPW